MLAAVAVAAAAPPWRERDLKGSRSTPAAVAPPAASSVVTIREPQDGFAITIPATWSRMPATDPQVRLLAAASSTTSLLVRVTPVGLRVTRRTLRIARSLTDALVGSDPRVRMIGAPQPLLLDGVPAYRYVYVLAHDQSVHVHYFAFLRRRMVALVFQVVGLRNLQSEAPLVEQVAETFRRV